MPSFTEPEILRHHPAAGAPSASEVSGYLRVAHAVAQRMEAILHSDEWETLRQGIEDLKGQDAASLASAEAQMSDGDAVGDALTTLKLRARYLRGCLDTWDKVLAMPMGLVTHAAEAQHALTEREFS